jgi:hypothetical protein
MTEHLRLLVVAQREVGYVYAEREAFKELVG